MKTHALRLSRTKNLHFAVAPFPRFSAKDSLEQGKAVKISGFGNFELRDKTSRPGRNPKTGEEIPITARRVVTFRSGQKLKARVDAYVGNE